MNLQDALDEAHRSLEEKVARKRQFEADLLALQKDIEKLQQWIKMTESLFAQAGSEAKASSESASSKAANVKQVRHVESAVISNEEDPALRLSVPRSGRGSLVLATLIAIGRNPGTTRQQVADFLEEHQVATSSATYLGAAYNSLSELQRQGKTRLSDGHFYLTDKGHTTLSNELLSKKPRMPPIKPCPNRISQSSALT